MVKELVLCLPLLLVQLLISYHQPTPPRSPDLMRKLEERVIKAKYKYVIGEVLRQ